MRLIIMYKNEMMDCVEDVEQAHFYEDKVIMNKLPLNITELKLEKVSSINCQDISIEQVKQFQDQVADLEAKLTLTEKALELSVEQLDDAKDMLREAGKPDWANTLDTSVDYFKARAKEMKDE